MNDQVNSTSRLYYSRRVSSSGLNESNYLMTADFPMRTIATRVAFAVGFTFVLLFGGERCIGGVLA